MSDIENICRILEQKKEKFIAYEAATKAMLDCEHDTAEHYITERAGLATEIDEMSEQIGRLCDKRDNSALLMDIANARCNFENVPPELCDLFETAQGTRSVVARIAEIEKQVVVRFEKVQEEAKAQIRQNQNLPKIKKYLNDLSENPGGISITTGQA